MAQVLSENLFTPQVIYNDTVFSDCVVSVTGNYSNAVIVRGENKTIEFQDSMIVNSSSSNLSGAFTLGTLAMNYAGQFYDLENGRLVFKEGSHNVFYGDAAASSANPYVMTDTYGIVGYDVVFEFEENSSLKVVASGRKGESDTYCLEGRASGIYTKNDLSVIGVFSGEVLAESIGGTTSSGGVTSAFAFGADGFFQTDSDFGGTFIANSYLDQRYSNDVRPDLAAFVFKIRSFSVNGNFTSTLNTSAGFAQGQETSEIDNVAVWSRAYGIYAEGTGSIAGNMALNISCAGHTMLSGQVIGIFVRDSLFLEGNSENKISAVQKNYGVREFNSVDSGSIEVIGAFYSTIYFSGNVQDEVNVSVENSADDTSYVQLLYKGSTEHSLNYSAHGYKIGSGEIQGDFSSRIHTGVKAMPYFVGDSAIVKKIESTVNSSGVSLDAKALLIIDGNFDGIVETSAEGASSQIRGVNSNLSVHAYGISGNVPMEISSPSVATTDGGYLTCNGDFSGTFSTIAEGNSVKVLSGYSVQTGNINTETYSYGINAGYLIVNGSFSSDISAIAVGGAVSGALDYYTSVQNGTYASALWTNALETEGISGNLLAVAQSGTVQGIQSESCAITVRGALFGVQTVSGIIAASAESEATALYHYADTNYLTVTGVLYAGNYKLGGLVRDEVVSVSSELMTLLSNAEDHISELYTSSLNAQSAYAYYRDESYCPAGYNDLITFADGGLAFGNIELGVGDNGVVLKDNSAVYGTIASTNGKTTIVYDLDGTEDNHRFLKMADSKSLISSRVGIYVDNALAGTYNLIESDDLEATFADKTFEFKYGNEGKILNVGSSFEFSDGTAIDLHFNEERNGIVLSVSKSVLPEEDTVSPVLASDSSAVIRYEGTTAYITWKPASDNVGVAGYYVEFDGKLYQTDANTFQLEVGYGLHTVRYYAYDEAGNKSDWSAVSSAELAAPEPEPTGPSLTKDLTVALTNKSYKAKFSWGKADLEKGEKLRGYEAFLDGVSLGLLKSTSYSTKDLLSIGTHTFKVRAVNANGEAGEWYEETFDVKDVTAPSGKMKAVAEARMEDGHQVVDLSWEAAEDNVGVTKYLVEYGVGKNLVSYETTETSFRISGNAGEKLTVQIRAYDGSGNVSKVSKSSVTIVDKIAPDVVQNLGCVQDEAKYKATLTWDPSMDNSGTVKASGYYVTYATNEDFSDAVTKKSTKTTLSLSNLQANTTYYYKVTAYDKAKNESADSEVFSFFVKDVTPPSKPSMQVKEISDNVYQVTWKTPKDNVGIAGYELECLNASGEIIQSWKTAEASVSFTLPSAGEYTIRLCACDTSGNASQDAVKKIKVKNDLNLTYSSASDLNLNFGREAEKSLGLAAI